MDERQVLLTQSEIDDLLTEAARKGAHRAVRELLGVEEGDERDVRKDFSEMQDLLVSLRHMKSSFVSNIGKMLGYGIILLLVLVATNFSNISWSPVHFSK